MSQQVNEFIKWLNANTGLFKYKPVLVKEHDDEAFYRLEGLSKGLYFNVCEHWIDIWFEIPDGRIDLLCEIDMPEVATNDGQYFCSCCKEETVNYKSVEELYAKHTFIHLLNWVNKLTDKHYYQVIEFNPGGSFAVELSCGDISQRDNLEYEIDFGLLVQDKN